VPSTIDLAWNGRAWCRLFCWGASGKAMDVFFVHLILASAMLAWPQTKLKTEDVIAGEELSIIADVRAGPPQNNHFNTTGVG